MIPEKKAPEKAVPSSEPEAPLKRAPMLYLIIVYKLIKCFLFFSLAVVLYCKSDNDLPVEFQNLMTNLRIHPGNKFFTHLALQIGQLSEANVLWAAAGTLVYSLFSLIEGIGLLFRFSWAGWLAISESGFFIPIEFYDLSRKFSPVVFVILIMNIIFVWYLFDNRERLFRHHHPHQPMPPAA